MFLYTHFNKKAYSGDLILSEPFPSDWIGVKDIERRYLSRWEEHCMECAAPECYGNCMYYIKRADGKCQNTFYGIKYRKDLGNDTVCPSQLKFRKWGKIETVFNPSSLLAVTYRKIEGRYARFNHKFPFSRRLLRLLNMELLVRNIKSQPTSFVLQCYSSSPSVFCLYFEIFGHNRHSIMRRVFQIKQGYNQFILSMSDIILDVEEKMWVRVFSEKGFEAEVVFFLCDFVDLKLKETVQEPAAKVKCIAWDLDNTVWNGTLIESDPDEIVLRNGVRQAIIDLDARGILQVVVSKNFESDVMPVLQRLGILEYFVYVSANWLPKSQNLAAIAKFLNIHIDAFALIDDSAFERGEVISRLGNIRVYDESVIPELLSLSELDVSVTKEAVNRRKMYQQDAQRKTIAGSFSSNTSFLKDCGIVVIVNHIGDSSFERSYELLQRTNQLNLSGRRYRKNEFKELCDREPKNIFVFSCYDKYGDYGQIGCVEVHPKGRSLTIDEFVMSCRVAGKSLEPALFAWLMQRYDVDTLVLKGVDNKKNRLLIETLFDLGFTNVAPDGLLEMTVTREKAMEWERIVTVMDRTV